MTPAELNQQLIPMIESVVVHLLPNGRKEGRSWCAGSIHGEAGQSLRVCLEGARAGLWSDFADSGKGGDLLSLWQQCRGISFVETLKEAKAFAGISDEVPELYTPIRTKRTLVTIAQFSEPQQNLMKWFEERGIFKKSLDIYRVGQRDNTIIFPFYSPAGHLQLVKYRDLDAEEQTGRKKFWSNDNPEYHLWGWQAIDDNTRMVVICEGEIDALSWHQQGIPALSVPQGGGNGAQQISWIENDYDNLQRFETIYVSMDMDATGQKAVKPIIDRLGIERCRVVDLGEFKDANEAHVNGVVLQQYLNAARTQDPEELKQLIEHHNEIMDEFKNSESSGIKLPWRKTHKTIRIRPSEISVWAGINGHGKSIALSHICIEAVSQGEVVCIASMEMKPRKLGRKMYQQIIGHDQPNPSEADHAKRFLSERIWLFEAFGTAKATRIIEVFSYARKRYGITHFIVDSLAKCGFAEDDYAGQKDFVDRLMEFTREHNVHVHLVVHVRKKEDEHKIPGKLDIKGTGAITDMVDNVFIWWRNKLKEDAATNGKINKTDTDAVLNVVKQRETGEEPLFGLYFHRGSCQFLDGPDDGPKNYLN